MKAAFIAIAAFFATALGAASSAEAQSYDFDVRVGSPVTGPAVRYEPVQRPDLRHARPTYVQRHDVCPTQREMRQLRRQQLAREQREVSALQLKQDRRERREFTEIQRLYRRGVISAYELRQRQANLTHHLRVLESRERADLERQTNRIERREMARLVRSCNQGQMYGFERDWEDRMIIGDDYVRVDGRSFYY